MDGGDQNSIMTAMFRLPGTVPKYKKQVVVDAGKARCLSARFSVGASGIAAPAQSSRRYRARTASSRLDPVPNMKPVARPLATSKAKRLLAPSTNV